MALTKIRNAGLDVGSQGWTETASIGTLDAATETITGLPSTITELYMVWDSVTHSSASPSDWGIRLGTSGGLVTSGYKSNVSRIYDSGDVVNHVFYSHFAMGDVGSWGSGSTWSGQFYFWNIDSNTWVYNGSLRDSDGTYDVIMQWAGRVALGGTLDRIAVVVGSGTLSGGTIKGYYK